MVISNTYEWGMSPIRAAVQEEESFLGEPSLEERLGDASEAFKRGYSKTGYLLPSEKLAYGVKLSSRNVDNRLEGLQELLGLAHNTRMGWVSRLDALKRVMDVLTGVDERDINPVVFRDATGKKCLCDFKKLKTSILRRVVVPMAIEGADDDRNVCKRAEALRTIMVYGSNQLRAWTCLKLMEEEKDEKGGCERLANAIYKYSNEGGKYLGYRKIAANRDLSLERRIRAATKILRGEELEEPSNAAVSLGILLSWMENRVEMGAGDLMRAVRGVANGGNSIQKEILLKRLLYPVLKGIDLEWKHCNLLLIQFFKLLSWDQVSVEKGNVLIQKCCIPVMKSMKEPLWCRLEAASWVLKHSFDVEAMRFAWELIDKVLDQGVDGPQRELFIAIRTVLSFGKNELRRANVLTKVTEAVFYSEWEEADRVDLCEAVIREDDSLKDWVFSYLLLPLLKMDAVSAEGRIQVAYLLKNDYEGDQSIIGFFEILASPFDSEEFFEEEARIEAQMLCFEELKACGVSEETMAEYYVEKLKRLNKPKAWSALLETQWPDGYNEHEDFIAELVRRVPILFMTASDCVEKKTQADGYRAIFNNSYFGVQQHWEAAQRMMFFLSDEERLTVVDELLEEAIRLCSAKECQLIVDWCAKERVRLRSLKAKALV
tara:strand:- start:107094 stop:109067 length:1974 start_codon:yes stop_codon:yes gene_type:complete